MAKYIFNVRIEANEYAPIDDLLDKAGYDVELLETYEGDEDDEIARGIDQIQLYLVNETKHIIGEEQDMMDNETIYVFTDRKRAVEEARGLNKSYGKSCIFSEEWDFEAVDYDECYTDDLHYFEVVPMRITK